MAKKIKKEVSKDVIESVKVESNSVYLCPNCDGTGIQIGVVAGKGVEIPRCSVCKGTGLK